MTATRRTSSPNSPGSSGSRFRPIRTSYGRSADTPMRVGSSTGLLRRYEQVDYCLRASLVRTDLFCGDLGIKRAALRQQLDQAPPDVAEQQRSSFVEPHPLDRGGGAHLQP